jgi:putative heme-binding domain-containing protein
MLRCFFALCALPAGLASVTSDLQAADSPNVVLIISDDQAWTDYSFMGHEHIQTPHLDILAKESLTFTRGYVPDSLCRPSLATIISGLYPHQHGIVGNDPPPPEDLANAPKRKQRRDPRYLQRRIDYIKHIDKVPRLAEMLKAKGYVSHQSGKWWEGHFTRGGFTNGMTHGDRTKGGRHGDKGLAIGRQGMEPVFSFIDDAVKEDKPFFVYYAPFMPHTPHTPPKRLLDKYRDQTPHEPIAKYWAMCEWFDETCGQLLNHLEEQKIADNTIVVYVTDNGWINQENRSAYAPRSKRTQYEGGIRTPIMIRWPGKVQPKMDKTHLASSIDLVPTILAAAGLEPTKEMQGINLMDKKAVSDRKAIFGEIFEHDIQDMNDPVASLMYRWVIDGDYKLILPYEKRLPNAKTELFNLEKDPFEKNDLSAEHPELVEKLTEKINDWWTWTIRTSLIQEKQSSQDGLSPADATPHWIWSSKEPEDGQVVFFRKEFRLQGRISTANLYVTCDDECRVILNGKPACTSKGWNQVTFKDLSEDLKRGSNVLAVRGRNGKSAAGLLLKLDLETDRQGKNTVVTDETWMAAEAGPRARRAPNLKSDSWKQAVSVGELGSEPWTNVNTETLANVVKLREPTATPIDHMIIKKGFKVELLYTVPKDEQGSWVNMCTDLKGRLIVSDQYGKLYRVTLPHLSKEVSELTIEPINVDIGEAQGLLWAFDSLYVMVNKGRKYNSGLYRVTDTDGDDQLDTVETLRELNGGGEHGPHAVVKTPDGEGLYVVCGDNTKITNFDATRVPPIWDEDQLLPRVLGRFMVGVPAPGGWVGRIDPDGKNWELLCVGFRNEFDADVNLFGDLFTYDADMEWDLNTPWYRPTRVCQVVSGGEFGWRSSAGKFPEYYPDSVPPTINIGPGSPTGVAFGYGAKFPEKYQRAYFASDWSYGILYAVHMTPDGASYKAEKEKFITGSPLPLTDVIIHPQDGAMYFLIGGRRVQSGLYRVTYTGSESTEQVPPVDPDKIPAAHKTRRMLESYHGKTDPAAVEKAWPYLGSEDRFLRYAARTAIEFQDPELWAEKALQETDPQASITALIALSRVKGQSPAVPELGKNEPNLQNPELLPDVLNALNRIEWSSLKYQQKLELLRAYSLAFTRLGAPEELNRRELAKKFTSFAPAQGTELNNELLAMLVYLKAENAAEIGVALLNSAPTQEEQIAYAKSLRHLDEGWTPELRKQYLSWFSKALGYGGGASFRIFVNNIKKDAVAKLSEEQQEKYEDVLNAAPPKNVNPFAEENRPFVKKWTMEDLAPLVESKLKNRNYERGRRMFGAANCYACHRFNNEGGAVGPDLSGLGGRFSPRDMLESILEPNKEISDQYAATQFIMNDGKVIIGRIANLSGDDFRVITDMLDPGSMVKVNRRQIDEMFPSKSSMMPAGLLDKLHEEEILDLMAYLLSRGDRDHPYFKER